MEKFNILTTPLHGANLIEASAGTGKTYALCNLYLRLILEKGLMIEDILAVTFTEAATEELRLRIRGRLREACISLTRDNAPDKDDLLNAIISEYRDDEGAIKRLRYSIMNFDEASIFTIHSFCQKMLIENAFESRELFDTELVTDQSGILQEITDDFWRINFYRASELFIQYVKEKKISVETFAALIKKRSIDPDHKIIPEIEKPEIGSIESKIYKAFNNMKEAWPPARQGIGEILLNSPALKRNTYSIKSVEAILSNMEVFLNAGAPLLKFGGFDKFTSTKLNASVKKGCSAPRHEFFDICDDFQRVYEEAVTVFDNYILYLKRKLFIYVEEELVKRKFERNVRSFDDLLCRMHEALRSGHDSDLALAVRRKYRAALIDEFQDTDPVQYDIFTTIFSGTGSILYLIGDPKQAIYKFRGADIFAYFRASAKLNSTFTLGTNWRSEPDYISSVNTIFSLKRNPFVFNKIVYNKTAPPDNYDGRLFKINGSPCSAMNIWFIDRSYGDSEDGTINKGRAEKIISGKTAMEIAKLIKLGEEGEAVIGNLPVLPGDITVLVRKNYQAAIVKEALSAFNIPSVIYSNESVFSTHEAMEIERLIKAINEPGNESLIRAALSTDIMGLSGDEIFRLIDNESEWEEYLDKFHYYHDLWIQKGFIAMFRTLITEERVRQKELSFENGERRITNILHCAELIHRAEQELKLTMDSSVKWLSGRRADPSETDDHQLRLETDNEAVSIVTIHRSKGLEYPIVFCPFAWDGSSIAGNTEFTFHDPERDYAITLDLGSGNEKNLKTAELEDLAENMRLLYVAVTRAKHACYIAWGKINKSESSAPAYLFHYPGGDADFNVSGLSSTIKELSHEKMLADLKKLEERSGGTVKVSPLPDFQTGKFSPHQEKNPDPVCRKFTGAIPADWRITSFSSLTSGEAHFEERDYDRSENINIDERPQTESMTIHNFPGGARAGTCVHEIFECIDFTDNDTDKFRDIIHQKTERYGFAHEWDEILYRMIDSVISTPLTGDDPSFLLKNIPEEERLNELEFYFPLNKITPENLSAIFEKYGNSPIVLNFSGPIENLGFSPVRGFVRGFIDLIFRYRERYYIIDWKSNYLGPGIEDYSVEYINEAMSNNHYILQYHLYSIALHQYLRLRIPDYSYERHFGGVFYIFLRGVDREHGPDYGVYRDTPSPEFINSLTKFITGNNG